MKNIEVAKDFAIDVLDYSRQCEHSWKKTVIMSFCGGDEIIHDCVLCGAMHYGSNPPEVGQWGEVTHAER